jgi:hypothetical protein
MNVKIQIADICVEVDDFVDTPTVEAVETLLSRTAQTALSLHAHLYQSLTETVTTSSDKPTQS